MDFENFFHWDEFWQFQDITLWRLVLSFCLSAICGSIIAKLHQFTYKGSGYTQSMFQSVILLTCIVALVMVVIGSNIARAFSLVGALSIIRFRTAVKNTRDTSFIFLAVMLGMAAGSRFYATAVVGTIMFTILILTMHYSNSGSAKSLVQLLRIRFPQNINSEKPLQDLFDKMCDDWRMISSETIVSAEQNEVTYQVRLKSGTDNHDFMSRLRELNQNQKIIFMQPDREISL